MNFYAGNQFSRVVADGGTWRLKWVSLKVGESNGKLPPRTCPGCSVPEPYRSYDWSLVPAKPSLQGWILMNEGRKDNGRERWPSWLNDSRKLRQSQYSFFPTEIQSKTCWMQVRSVAVWEHIHFCFLVTPRIIQSRLIKVGPDQKTFGPSSKHLQTGRCNRLTANIRIRNFALHKQRPSSQ